MIRFQCIHCGGRIAVPDDHMDRLARCPECGGVTHPLAEHLAGAGKVDPSRDDSKSNGIQSAAPTTEHLKAAPPASEPDTAACDNCGGPLGKLQKPFEWDGHFVCGPCHRILSLEKAPPEDQAPSPIVERETPANATPVSVVEPVIVGSPKQRSHPSDFALIVRTACIGLCIAAVALYVIVSILQSLGYIVMWGGIAVAVLAAVYWIRRGFLAIRRRASKSGPGLEIVREQSS